MVRSHCALAATLIIIGCGGGSNASVVSWTPGSGAPLSVGLQMGQSNGAQIYC
jgi:hypothetical protein